jgi:hypothetical protein
MRITTCFTTEISAATETGVGVGVGVGVGPEEDDNAPLPQEAARKSKGTRQSDATYFMSRIDAGFFGREVCLSTFRAGFLS